MKTRHSKNKADDSVVPMRIPADLNEEVEHAAEQIRLSKADTMRKAMEMGLPVLVDLLKRKSLKQAA